MSRKDLRNRNPKFNGLGAKHRDPWPRARRALKLSTVLKVLGVLLLLAALWHTSPSRLFPECRGNEVPRYCVD